jgi:hypothetical protein
MRKLSGRISLLAGAAFLAAAGGVAAGIGGASADAAVNQTTFHMVRSAASVKANCLNGADAKVTIESQGPVEVMRISAKHLPPNTDFDLFVIQVPNAPFGLSWYQGDLESDSSGHAHGTFIGRFSVETFIVAPGTAPAPVVFSGPFPDASSNPPTNPVQLYHLGLWFNSPKDAAAAGCLGTVTPFNGEHDAGVQALSTQNFPIQAGPLRKIH